VTDRFVKAVIEHVGRGQYLYSCDACSRVTTEVTSIFMGPRGEKIDLCGACLNDASFKSVKRRPSRTEVL
jgi:predicted SprT family Zn-dependent metalloprotease